MSFQLQVSGWLSTNKTSKIKETRSDFSSSALHQTSMLNFFRKSATLAKGRKNVSTTEKENRTSSNKRKKADDSNTPTAKKARKIAFTQSALASDDEIRTACSPGRTPGTPIIVADSPDCSVWNDATLWDSASSSGTSRVDPRLFKNLRPKATINDSTIYLPQLPRTGHGSFHTLCKSRSHSRRHMKDDPFRGATSSPPSGCFEHDNDALISSSRPQEQAETIRPDSQLFAPSSFAQAISTRFSTLPDRENTAYASDEEEIIPSSQSQHLLDYKRSPSRRNYNQGQEYGSEEITSSSQSQYILLYEYSPCRIRFERDPTVPPTELIPSSQSQYEQELHIPLYQHYSTPPITAGLDDTGKYDSDSTSLSPKRAATGNRDPFVDERRNSGIHDLVNQMEDDVLASTDPSPSLQTNSRVAETRVFNEEVASQSHTQYTMEQDISTQELPVNESQYTFVEEPFPPEVINFLDRLDDGLASLESDFNLPNLLDCVEEGTKARQASPIDIPKFQRSQLSNTQESLFPVSDSFSIPVGQESQYIFVEESYPAEVVEFLDRLDGESLILNV